MDCKATVKMGDYARGGKTRGDYRATDHEMGRTPKYVPFGLVDEDSGQLYLTFGSSSKTSDFIVDRVYDWWNDTPTHFPQAYFLLLTNFLYLEQSLDI